MGTSKQRVNWNAVVTASLGGLLFGFDAAVISGVTEVLRGVFGLSAIGLGAAVLAALIGTLIGALGAGKPGDTFGSRVRHPRGKAA
jgi:MFS family permease